MTPAPLPDRLELDRLAAAAWPALEQRESSGWLLRATRTATGAAVTKRATSGLRLAPGPVSDAELADLVAFYRSRDLPPLVQVSDPGLAAALEARGWPALSPTLVLTGPVPAGQPGPVAAEPAAAWLAAWADIDGQAPEEREVVADCLARIDSPTAYAGVEVAGRLVAVGRGVVQPTRAGGRALGVFSMGVLPAHRRRGLGRRVLGALGAWAVGLGADLAYLQVEVGSTAARRLYEGAGLTGAGSYHYRRCP